MRTDRDVFLLNNLTDIFPVRLTGGSEPRRGILEIFVNGQWGTVCDDSFGKIEADAACKQLGYGNSDSYSSRQSGTSSAPIWMDDVYCIPRATSRLADCQTTSSNYPFTSGLHWGKHNCVHAEDVEIVCFHGGRFIEKVLKYLYQP